ncbi:unnamed protein product [Kuraishia capsulata CBS 1993]|uniref:Cell wall mannoprotein PIR1-like C-terminal domain-containing protein n=1 Tax=Kuraishia capsulata CBS 1993 TaxID=1382522 RepID=W6MWE5_9ASCO|nr:uncharacterized protein KUCA_T00003283001 [Kuraishia capsulata CBS 1993]CDK27305.1 unnamed protein product [Kuraishia capsulata CBS 1993]
MVKTSILGYYLLSSASAGYVVGDVWSTLTPDASAYTDATTDYTQTFGIAIEPVTSSVVLTSASSGVAISTTVDGTAQVITQIGDGQIQAATTTSSYAVVTQIGDGQIQAVATATSSAPIISQIGDGQIQATASSLSSSLSSSVVTSAVSSSDDDPITFVTVTPTTLVYVTVTDGDDEPTSTAAVEKREEESRALADACLTDSSLALTLASSVLTDKQGRIGSIVANRQFQFDGPPPQAGAIFAAGWSVTIDGKLALGNQTIFYQCLSGTFYNLYDEYVAEQCEAVYLNIVDLVSC